MLSSVKAPMVQRHERHREHDEVKRERDHQEEDLVDPLTMPRITPRVFPVRLHVGEFGEIAVATGMVRNEYGNVNHSRA